MCGVTGGGVHTWWTAEDSSAWLRERGLRIRPAQLERCARQQLIRSAFFDGQWVFDPEVIRALG